MAEVRLSDAVVPTVFTRYLQVRTAEKTLFRRSGVVVDVPFLDQALEGGARSFSVPFWKDVSNTEALIASDDPSVIAAAQKIGSGQEIAQRHELAQVWSAMDLVAVLAGSDPMRAIANVVGDYWDRQEQFRIISSVQGLVADNIANDSGDMVVNIALPGAGVPGPANFFSAEAVLDAMQTMGDAQQDLGVIAMHSVVFTRAKKNNLIDFRPDSNNPDAQDIPFYNGLRVVVDDGMPVTTVSGNFNYDTYIFAPGSILRGRRTPKIATEIYRLPLAGNAAGQEFLINRVEWAHHPRGFAWLTASQASTVSPTLAELKLAANWDRRYAERKQIKVAVLRTNG